MVEWIQVIKRWGINIFLDLYLEDMGFCLQVEERWSR